MVRVIFFLFFWKIQSNKRFNFSPKSTIGNSDELIKILKNSVPNDKRSHNPNVFTE